MIRSIVVILLLLNSVNFIAQRTSSSPYSYFGIGDQFSPRTVEQNAMGGIGVAFSHYKYLNFTNPAAYADLRATSYTIGLLNSDLTVKSGSAEQNSTSTSLSYIALAFPVGKNAGVSFGMQPVSAVGYSLSNTILVNGSVSEVTAYSGNGGVNRFYGSFGIKVYKGFTLGVEADFSFGDIENSIINQRANVSLATKYNEVLNLRGTSVKFGAQYQKELENSLTVTAGATVKLGNSLNVEGNDYLYSFRFANSGAESPKDTLSSTLIDGEFNLPLKSNFGVGLGKLDKWYAGVEYETQNAIGSNNLLTNTTGAYRYGKSDRISLGGFYLPKVNSISSYWERVTYRAGVRYENTGLLVDGTGNNSNFTKINDFGISFGLGLPLKRLSTVNMGFEFGKRGTTENNLIQENYFNFRLSLSLTDTNWFIKRKID
ncbi:TonB-dependent receptor [Polaribacter sp. Hel_I_88]|uniref:TonB-dependent receptor n=1 Tax=Polaribacter sp. Hel_I_88 TaxID=1250006 RepID=UPI000479A1F5|nr:TonB-dependent receptor [Polaribacter sp. Hel_I_88]